MSDNEIKKEWVEGISSSINTFMFLSPPKEKSLNDIFNTSHKELLNEVTEYFCKKPGGFGPKGFKILMERSYKRFELNKINKGIERFEMMESGENVWSLLKTMDYNRDTYEARMRKQKNSEVYTPSEIIDKMLDALPKEIWTNPNTTFFDPACGRGVFLLRLKERLNKTLKHVIKDDSLRERHIVEKMLFGQEIKPLQVKIARRVIDLNRHFKTNIRLGNSLNKEFMVTEYKGRKFDVVIANPPYSKSLEKRGYAEALYPEFVELAHNMTKRYVMMITPHRWTNLSRLESHQKNMIFKYGLKYIKLFKDSTQIFGDNIVIKGGVSYFLCDNQYEGKVRFHIEDQEKHNVDFRKLNDFPKFIGEELETILDKTKNSGSIYQIFSNGTIGTNDKRLKEEKQKDSIKVFCARNKEMYISEEHKKDCTFLGTFKVAIPSSMSVKEAAERSIILSKNETFNDSKVGFRAKSKEEAENIISFMSTDLFKFLSSLKQANHRTRGTVFKLVPMMDFSKKWDNDKVNKHFDINSKELKFMKDSVIKAEVF